MEKGEIRLMWMYASLIFWGFFQKINSESDEIKFSGIPNFIFDTLCRTEGDILD